MAVALNLTTRQEPIFNKAMKEAKLKVVSKNGTLELTKDNFNDVADAVMQGYLRETMSEGPNEDTFMYIAQKVSVLEDHFPPADEEEQVTTQIKDWPEND